MLIHQPSNSLGNYNENTFVYNGIKWYPHFHRNYEVAFVMAGNVRLALRDEVITAKKGDWIFILSNQIHSYDGDADSKTLVTVFSEDFVPLFREAVNGMTSSCPIFRASAEFSEYAVSRLSAGCPLMEKKGIFYSICSAFLSTADLSPTGQRSDSGMMDILGYIGEHYSEPLTLCGIADRFGYEPHYLSRLFNRTYRINFRRLLNSYRVDAAKKLLTEKKLNITEISEACGFPSIRSMNYVFREMTGQTPSEYARPGKLT